MVNGANPYLYGLNQQKQSEPIGLGVIPITGGEPSALSYNQPANSNAIFISSDTNELFMKSVDINGMVSSFRAFDLIEKMTSQQNNMVDQNYVTKSELNDLRKDIQDLRQFLDDLTKPNKKE